MAFHIMGRETMHNKVLDSYVKHLILRDSLTPPSILDIAEACLQLLTPLLIQLGSQL
jgi:hypothetical protein